MIEKFVDRNNLMDLDKKVNSNNNNNSKRFKELNHVLKDLT